MRYLSKYLLHVLIALIFGGVIQSLLFGPLNSSGFAFHHQWLCLPFEILPVVLSIAVSGNPHQGSVVAFWVGFVLQWAIIGTLTYFARRLISKNTTSSRSLPPTP